MSDGLVKLREGTSVAAQLTVKNYNALVDAVRRSWIRPGPNTLMNQDSGGTQLWQRQLKVPPKPVDNRTLLVSQSGGTTVVVSYGTINNVPPTIGGVLINHDPAPKLTISSSGVVYLHAVVNADGVITALTIETASSTPANTKTDGYQELASVTVASSVITNVTPSAWNLVSMLKCGSTTYIFGGFS